MLVFFLNLCVEVIALNLLFGAKLFQSIDRKKLPQLAVGMTLK